MILVALKGMFMQLTQLPHLWRVSLSEFVSLLLCLLVTLINFSLSLSLSHSLSLFLFLCYDYILFLFKVNFGDHLSGNCYPGRGLRPLCGFRILRSNYCFAHSVASLCTPWTNPSHRYLQRCSRLSGCMVEYVLNLVLTLWA